MTSHSFVVCELIFLGAKFVIEKLRKFLSVRKKRANKNWRVKIACVDTACVQSPQPLRKNRNGFCVCVCGGEEKGGGYECTKASVNRI